MAIAIQQPYGNFAANLARQADETSTRLVLWALDNKKALIISLVALTFVLLALNVDAGTTATEFQGIYNKLKDWVSGYLGKAIAMFAFVLGLGIGVAKSSPIPAISGIVFALFVAFGPAVLEGIATATL
ncbi:MAG: TraA family conjugative transfer protein [Thiothrix sp.]|uniref:TraA family conjugative transfer protein n=1 Tax=Thiothrix sp. TaxID=1032 RepID=UPI002605ED45|nr:TraA family conjugative transfer protein [Thiothrix sp.]MDD5395005.1 TraA family conjugative transfer protein [Thiothrix sp.]